MTSGLAVAGTCGGFDGVTVLRAATHASCSQCSPPTWHVVETANFYIQCYGQQAVDRATADACEAQRDRLAKRWLGQPAAAPWTPKCQLVLHASDASYEREIGTSGSSTLASALVERSGRRISLRRIDVRATRAGWQTAALAHELAHVVIADRFPSQPLPRWADEGIAILADPRDKQRRHLRDYEQALAARGEFRLHELVTLSEYPPAGRWGTFYGQSASLVEFLVRTSGERQFIEFVDASLAVGFERGLRQVYDLHIAELEGRLRDHVLAGRSNAAPSAAQLVQVGGRTSSVGQ